MAAAAERSAAAARSVQQGDITERAPVRGRSLGYSAPQEAGHGTGALETAVKGVNVASECGSPTHEGAGHAGNRNESTPLVSLMLRQPRRGTASDSCSHTYQPRERRPTAEGPPPVLNTAPKHDPDSASPSAATSAGRPEVLFLSIQGVITCPPGDPVGMAMLALIRAQECVHIRDDGHLELSEPGSREPLAWPCATNNVLYVRSCYAPLFEVALDRCKSTSDMRLQNHVVTGQPGIGKSVFGWYLLYRLLSVEPHRTVIYAAFNLGQVYMAHGGQVYCAMPEDFFRMVAWPVGNKLDSVLIVDSFVPRLAFMPTVVIGSPGRVVTKDAKDILNFYRRPWYMPCTTEDEVLGLRRVAFPHVDEEECAQRMARWGPIPRLVLVFTDQDDQDDLWGGVRNLTTDQLNDILVTTATGDGAQTSHLVLHQCAKGQGPAEDEDVPPMQSTDYFAKGLRVFASSEIQAWVLERRRSLNKFHLRSLLDATAKVANLASARGNYFEPLALETLLEGGRFTLHDLQLNRAMPFDIPEPLERVRFRNIKELRKLKKEARRLLVPTSKNFGAVDALIWDESRECCVPINCTAGKRHPIHGPHLADVFTALQEQTETTSTRAARAETRFIWIVPEGEEGTAKAQPILPPLAADYKPRGALKQFVLRIPLMATIDMVCRVVSSSPAGPQAAAAAGAGAGSS